MDTRESSAPLLGLFSIICKHVYWYTYNRSQVSVYRTIGPLVLIFVPKHRLRVLVSEAILISLSHNLTYNQCLSRIGKNMKIFAAEKFYFYNYWLISICPRHDLFQVISKTCPCNKQRFLALKIENFSWEFFL